MFPGLPTFNLQETWLGNYGRFPFEQKNQFEVPECPVAKWNATA
jgi:hypothetical protein